MLTPIARHSLGVAGIEWGESDEENDEQEEDNDRDREIADHHNELYQQLTVEQPLSPSEVVLFDRGTGMELLKNAGFSSFILNELASEDGLTAMGVMNAAAGARPSRAANRTTRPAAAFGARPTRGSAAPSKRTWYSDGWEIRIKIVSSS